MRDRGLEILEAGILVATSEGFRNVTRERVAIRAGVSTALVNLYWGTIQGLRDRIVEEAVRRELLPIVAQALLDKHPIAQNAPRRLLERVARHLIHG